MKKYLSIICALLTLTAFASCGDNNSSSDSSEVPESSITETTTEIKDFTTLDSDWECDYLKIATNSNWKEQSELNGKMFDVGWDWSENDDDKDFFPRIRLTVDGFSLGRKTQSELQAYGEEMVKDYTDPNSEYYDEYYKDYRVIETFTENGQSYLVMGDDSISLREIYFWTDDFWGYFYTSTNYEEIVRNMIETIEFY